MTFAELHMLYLIWLVPVVVALFVWGAARRRHILSSFASAKSRESVLPEKTTGRRRVKAGLMVSAVLFLILALAGPRYGYVWQEVERKGVDIIVALDCSKSMLAGDVNPSRLARAKREIIDLLAMLEGDRIGLVAFAGDAFVQSPLTVDYTAAAMFLNAMEPDMMPIQGTDLGEGLRMSLDALDEAAREDRLIVVVTDGEDHEGAIDEQLQRAADGGVQIHTVGIGSTEGVPIPEIDAGGVRRGFKRDEEGNVVTTHLDEGTLRRMAEATGGRYVRVAPGLTTFEELVDEIASGEGEEFEAREITQFEEQYQIFLALALALLFVEALVPERRRTTEAWSGRFE